MAGPTVAIREQCPLATPLNDGLMSAQQAAELASIVIGGSVFAVYTSVTRPDANAVGAVPGVTVVAIWNSDDHQPNYSDGVNWYDAAGNLT
jgi:hypothetical protein